MNHREPPHRPAGVRHGILCLTLALLPVLAPVRADALPRTRPPGSGPEPHHAGAIPYLPVVGAPALRFQPPPPSPVFPEPASLNTPGSPAETLPENPAAPERTAAGETVSDASATEPPPATPIESRVATPPPRPVQPILPDSVTPTVRPEDFLPYFQIPGTARGPGDVTLLVPAPLAAPAPAPIPPSSATYRQTP